MVSLQVRYGFLVRILTRATKKVGIHWRVEKGGYIGDYIGEYYCCY